MRKKSGLINNAFSSHWDRFLRDPIAIGPPKTDLTEIPAAPQSDALNKHKNQSTQRPDPRPTETLYIARYTLRMVHCALYTVHCTLHTVQCTMHNAQCTMYEGACTIYSAQCTVYNVQVHNFLGVQEPAEPTYTTEPTEPGEPT